MARNKMHIFYERIDSIVKFSKSNLNTFVKQATILACENNCAGFLLFSTFMCQRMPVFEIKP